MNMVDLTNQLIEIVDSRSRIMCPFLGIFIADIYLKPESKEECAREIRDIVAKFVEANIQVIMTVMEDDDDKYANIISEGIDTNRITL